MLCGKEFEVGAKHLGDIKSCRECSIKSKIVDLTGMRFGRLVALEYIGRENGKTLWKCKCDCGKETITGYSNLLSGNTRSCGCMEYENRVNNMRIGRNQKNDDSASIHPLYSLWTSMKARCYNKNRKCYKNYGGRGIKICDRWSVVHGFENFVADMGIRPSPKHSIDRIDTNGDYCPENCRWATPKEQCNNKRVNICIKAGKQTFTVKQICDILGLNYNSIIHKVKRGIDINYIVCNKCDMRNPIVRNEAKKHTNYNRVLSIEISEYIDGRE